ncbi:MAG TPA: hypothetical protein DEG43_09885 [Acidimicrobiaceae bacterium]|nr:hypothetical protein [Acidimicrobiaceae bacterium]
MDVTPQLIEQIDFSEKFRGYDPDQVDDFLERVGATIAELNAALRESRERCAAAEQEIARLRAESQAVAQSPQPQQQVVRTAEDDALEASRTLLMASRTADAVIAEARDEAARTVAEARSQAEQSLQEASARAGGILDEAKQNAEKDFAERREAVSAEVAALEDRRRAALSDAEVLDGHVNWYRSKLEALRSTLHDLLDTPDGLHSKPIPATQYEVVMAEPAQSPGAEWTTQSAGVMSDPSGAPGFDQLAPHPEEPSFAEYSAATEAVPVVSPPLDESYNAEHARQPFEQTTPAGVGRAGTEAPSIGLDSTGFDLQFRPEPEFAARVESADSPPFTPENGAGAAAGASETQGWAPGSWSEAVAADQGADFGRNRLDDAHAAPIAFDDNDHPSSGLFEQQPVPVVAPAVAEERSEAFALTGQHERYLHELDQAVNHISTEQDGALSAFLEGDDDEQGRRFGRRR